MFHNLLTKTNNFCFGFIALSCFFETFPGGWLDGWLENGILMKTQFSNRTLTLSLDFDLGFVNWELMNWNSSKVNDNYTCNFKYLDYILIVPLTRWNNLQ